jgi:hypothetical protein
MNRKIICYLLILMGSVLLVTGCETTDQTAASIDPQFPPAPTNGLNAPLEQTSRTYNY